MSKQNLFRPVCKNALDKYIKLHRCVNIMSFFLSEKVLLTNITVVNSVDCDKTAHTCFLRNIIFMPPTY